MKKMPTLATIIQQSSGSPSYTNRATKKNKMNPNQKGSEELILFENDMIL